MSFDINFPKSWVCDGRELKPKSGASSRNTWVVEGRKIKPKNGANSSNTYDMGDHSILAVAGKLVFRLY
ncbi:hypothetical protein [Nitrosomonas oligotropha]|uniref:hypothetical protein n=1 Tax=Nitrosomonas oligotropha TaxID=42354 RepID=UPI00136BBB81|nr:hypothetical protein [Nitrosomonas oligotropha]MXS84200.1 hypothetical protein [Nitrosomonas oligotropha]